MIGFFFGAACVLGLGMVARRRRGYRRDCGPVGGRFGHHGRRGHEYFGEGYEAAGTGNPYRGAGHNPWMSRRFVGWLATRIEATPEQRRVIADEMEQFLERAKEVRSELRLSRSDIATALRAESFDAELMGESFGRQDEKLRGVREAMVGALARVHDVLDADQRARLGRILDGGGPFGRGQASW